MKRHFLDLFAGFGGASEAFVQDVDNWTVLRIDNNLLLQNVPNMRIECVKEMSKIVWPFAHPSGKKIDCIWASPPCREFSDGSASPKSKAQRNGTLDTYEPDISLLEAALQIIQIVKPKYWIIENVRGSIPYFKKYLGNPRQIVGPYYLWGNFPYLDIDSSQIAAKSTKDVHSSNPLRANYKAQVDFALSLALKNAVEKQSSILDF